MKKILKNNRGITLVALIITIIVLLILAVVSITSISNSNIIKHAKDAKEKYSVEEEKEKITLALHEAVLEAQGSITKSSVENGMTTYFGETGWEEVDSSDSNIMIVEIVSSKRKYKITLSTGKVELITDGTDTPEPNPEPAKEEVTWVQSGNSGERSKTKVTGNNSKYNLEVGQTVKNFNAGNFEWKVLGVENGKLLLTTASNITDNYTIDGQTAKWDSTSNSYAEAEAGLTTYCQENVSIAGTNAESIRSIKVEDINRITGYEPTNQGDGTVYGGTIGSMKIPEYNSDKNYANGIYLPTETQTSNNVTIRCNRYEYNLSSLVSYFKTTSDSICYGISKTSLAYQMILGNLNSNSGYFLAWSCVTTGGDAPTYYMGCVSAEVGGIWGAEMWDAELSKNAGVDCTAGVRAVVTMDKYFIPEV